MARIRCIFQIVAKWGHSGETLIYIELFEPAPGTVQSVRAENDEDIEVHLADEDSKMFRLVRSFFPDGRRREAIVKYSEIWQPVDLMPFFEGKADRAWKHTQIMEQAKEFLVNCFDSKETFQSVH